MASGSGAPTPERSPHAPSAADVAGGADSFASAARKSSPDLLRHVLEETLARGAGEMSSEELAALRDVAQALAGSHMDMSLIAEKLVAALLSKRFPDLANPDAHRQMSRRIAASLCGDPTSMQRLKTLWNQLRQSIK